MQLPRERDPSFVDHRGPLLCANRADETMAEARGGTILEKFGLRPITPCNLARFYGPAFGVVNYTLLSVKVMNPNLTIRVFPEKDTAILMWSTLLGTGSYIYTREHMKKAAVPKRLMYSAAGALFLSFGSVLIWAVLRSVLPSQPVFCTIAGIGSGAFIIGISRDYLTFVDGQVKKQLAG